MIGRRKGRAAVMDGRRKVDQERVGHGGMRDEVGQERWAKSEWAKSEWAEGGGMVGTPLI